LLSGNDLSDKRVISAQLKRLSCPAR
jgi:hypothetical protein